MELVNSPSEDFLCDRYRLSEKQSTEGLLALLVQLEHENPGYIFYLTLDDFGQATYTSMHSKMSFDLDCTDGYDLSSLPSECFEDGDHLGYLSHKEEFFIRKGNIEKQLDKVTFESVCAKGISLSNSDYDDEIESFKYDLASLVDDCAFILKVPASSSYEALYAFPNGYFSCDLNPMENTFLAKMLQEQFSYEFIGMGASYIAFKRTKDLEEKDRLELIETLNKVYCDDFDLKLRNELLNTIYSNNVLVLKYTE
ncbi:hypothetical protein [Enterovibrio norvegicus]|uniref:hypothetical protein n=1 Tax=Enterovibrio norvegicus TaxID=188144 RepID=UPI000C84E01B|nr:hypothetical protein [Enterovibrio norvegicus]PMN72137.1 hypothetical protein BCT27_14900 [Enterovibrio norvegicus]